MLVLEGAEVTRVGGPPCLHDRGHEKGKQLRPEKISLLDTNNGVNDLFHAVNLKLDVNCLV